MLHLTRYLATRLRRLASPAPATRTYCAYTLPSGDALRAWDRLDAFVIAPTGTVRELRERELAQENARTVITLIGQDGARLVRRVTELHESGAARASEPGLLALTLAHAYGDAGTREGALRAMARVARAGAPLTPPGLASAGATRERGRLHNNASRPRRGT